MKAIEAELQLRIAVATAEGWTLHKASSSIKDPLIGMELVCGRCSAVLRCRKDYQWNKHESCGPMGCDCYGGNWKLFESCWSKDNKVAALPDYPADRNAIIGAVVRRFADNHDAFAIALGRLVTLTLGEKWSASDYYFALATATAEQLCRAYLSAAAPASEGGP